MSTPTEDPPTTATPAPGAGKVGGLLTRAHLPFVLATLAMVTTSAFADRAVSTVLPTVARELDGLPWFGAASAAPLISYLVATALAGVWTDRRGPAAPLRLGVTTFALASAASGLAPAMVPFVLARVVGGVAEGMLDVSLTVLVARALPARLRPRMFAAISTAWILPSVVGPGVAGLVTSAVGWRWVFLLPLILLGPAVVALRTHLRDARSPSPAVTPPGGGGDSATVRGAVLAAGALAVVTAVGPLADRPGLVAPLATAAVIVLGSVAALVALRSVVPPGTTRLAAGVPALVALSGVLFASFGTAGAFIPLMLTTLRDTGPALAGVSLSVTGAFWSLGSWVQSLDHVQRRTSAVGRLRAGFSLVALGTLGPLLLALSSVPIVWGMALWAFAATGTGICSPTLATTTMALTEQGALGRVSAARALAMSVAQSILLAGAGAVLAARADDLTGAVFAAVFLVALFLAVTGALASGRVRT